MKSFWKQIVSLLTLLAVGVVTGIALIFPVWQSGQFNKWWLAVVLALALLGAAVLIVSLFGFVAALKAGTPLHEANHGRRPSVRDEAADICQICIGAVATMICKTHGTRLCGGCHAKHDRADCTYRFSSGAAAPLLANVRG